jgi:hypothetical protein
MNTPRLKLMELREYVSERTGSTYFAGYLGNARVVMLRDDRAAITGKEKARWSVLLEEQKPRGSVRVALARSRVAAAHLSRSVAQVMALLAVQCRARAGRPACPSRSGASAPRQIGVPVSSCANMESIDPRR